MKWEYKNHYIALLSAHHLLREHGASGWELVTVVAEPTGTMAWFFFKRPVAQ